MTVRKQHFSNYGIKLSLEKLTTVASIAIFSPNTTSRCIFPLVKHANLKVTVEHIKEENLDLQSTSNQIKNVCKMCNALKIIDSLSNKLAM